MGKGPSMEDIIKLSEEQLRLLQRKNLEIAEYFIKFCYDHDLRVYIFAGACLGAIRHKGFIPWDDDIDMCMPAPDYYKLLELWDKEADTDRYSLCVTTREYNDHHLTSSIRDNNTTLIIEAGKNTDTNQGVAIDFTPLHAAAKTQIGQIIQLTCACGCSLFKAGRLPNRQSRKVYYASKILLRLFKSEKARFIIWSTLEKIATLPDKHYENAKYVKEFTMFPFISWLYPKEWFDSAIWVPFEETRVPIAKGSKEYLEKRYGNYMELPPEKDRHPEHRVVFIDLENSYLEYKGKHYLNK